MKKLDDHDKEIINQMYNSMVAALRAMPDEILKSNQFGMWAYNAILKLTIASSQVCDIDSETLKMHLDMFSKDKPVLN